jgi:hypothetical protein
MGAVPGLHSLQLANGPIIVAQPRAYPTPLSWIFFAGDLLDGIWLGFIGWFLLSSAQSANVYDPNRPAEAKSPSNEGLWLTSALVMLLGAGLSLLSTGLFVSVLR